MSNPHLARLYIGLMSGTSLDGIDAALVSFQDEQLELKAFKTFPYADDLKSQLNQLNQTPHIDLKALCDLEYRVAKAFSDATQQLLNASNYSAAEVTAIGSHGQTIFHAPDIPMSLQIGHPAFIAKHTGITTAADFRIDDMANKGQGAPLAPAFHQKLFGTTDGTAVVNIGGISNITYLDNQKALGFDTGPGNGLMDEYCERFFNCAYDANGKIAITGQVNTALLSDLMKEPYFSAPAPKTTGKDLFNYDWLSGFLAKYPAIAKEDALSTLNQLTVDTLIQGLNALPAQPKRLLICGGGAENNTLISRLQTRLDFPVETTQSFGIQPHAVEAMMCAWLAKQRLNNRPIALKQITGATQDSILGGIWHP
ncbi:anhydro-N-acetylmuramic acid kinase [Hydrogenovibrio sp. 3SP14C1]|uniref:anhydro-N-acetylmuramic acid kinase n=1 Tax=Hydrogenovibrio sp. 3SP14C1 TaxID=3038774 RepID=UPI00241704C4|nr:anhydro-N-acetylmuramic acid kinase [Hydrogenovibrio sp. 3SP14C1]MDG4812063.1 anhydro-N-acetylmuramic acid kinase [Hydrogenovibrio sp. 3SP14C1]